MMMSHIAAAKFPSMPRTQAPHAPTASQHLALASVFSKLAAMHADRALKAGVHVANVRPNMVGEANSPIAQE